MKHFTDEELVSLYLETHRDAYFERLYERYSGKVYRKCLSFIKDPVRAEDLTHDIFLRLISKLSSFRQQARFSTWLYTITYNHCADHIRVPNWRHEVLLDEGWEHLSSNPDDTTADQLEIQDQQVRQALKRLAPEEQTLLLLKYQEDISIREIANKQSLTESAVKMRLKRSRDKLRRYFMEIER
ncbi:RNA polymerase sigma factor sigW AltName: Full=Sigma-W factor [Fibrisoma limi BUZ 3]|uniref:WGS project CAIT00000000 data, contig 9 n=1 Tax=Fibrisoma limi BUZ 3 TaxID=1185876 RepID=I2GQ70_9BACT|nr:RNA polymerase sigma factor [Fibrisoma limi]CCH56048.1 RNA polymerase sigma factor sigW AltName: Full=Sigma-W factor [Fibrisoma limi BUZ 3]